MVPQLDAYQVFYLFHWPRSQDFKCLLREVSQLCRLFPMFNILLNRSVVRFAVGVPCYLADETQVVHLTVVNEERNTADTVMFSVIIGYDRNWQKNNISFPVVQYWTVYVFQSTHCNTRKQLDQVCKASCHHATSSTAVYFASIGVRHTQVQGCM